MMRAIHRWIGLIAVGFFVLIASAGVWLQIDTNTFYEIGAARLTDEQIERAHATAVQAVHQSAPQGRLSGWFMNVTGERPHMLVTFDSAGSPRQQLSLDPRSGAVIGGVGTLHGQMQSFHESLLLGQSGRWISLLVGLSLLLMCVSALAIYVRLLRQRIRLGRRGLFWHQGWMSLSLHRWFGSVAAAFLAIIAASGILIQLNSLLPRAAAPAAAPVAPATDADVQRVLSAGLESTGHMGPAEHLAYVSVAMKASMPALRLTYLSSTEGLHQFNFDLHSGAALPWRKTVDRYFVAIHRGDVIADNAVLVCHADAHAHCFPGAGKWISIISGISLVALAITGILSFLRMHRQRARTGRRALFWR
jgi:uncharacterized iron-regulated membrane protein